jgi:phosphoglycolate phosphatase
MAQMHANGRPAIVFDLDGTLADTMQDLIPVLNRTTATEGLPEIPLEKVGAVVGHGARAMIEKAFAYHGRPLGSGVLNRLFDAFLDDYERNIAVNTRLFDGVEAAMDRFSGSGWDLAVCTNKPEGLARKLLAELRVTQRFAAISGGDTFAFRKPDPRHLLQTLSSFGAAREAAVMVGDSITDVETAKAAGIPVVVVDFGYSDRPAAELGADRVIGHFEELWDSTASLLKA